MATDISLTAAIRENLLALQNTQSLQDQTQAHLATGQKVSSAIDDPVAFFQAAALNDRASDFQTNKDNIDQGISSLSTALQGITSIQTLVSQLKGIAISAQSATSAQIGTLVQQYNSLRGQIDTLAQDTSYQGLNLIAGSGQLLDVAFSNLTGSNLTVKSTDATTGPQGLNIVQAFTSEGGFQLGFQSVASGKLVGDGNAIEVVYSATAALTSGEYTFGYGTQTLTIQVASAGGFSAGGLTTTANFAPGTVYTVLAGSAQFASAGSFTGAGLNILSGTTSLGPNIYEGTSGNFFITLQSNTGAVVVTGGTIDVSFQIDGLTGNTIPSGTYTFNYAGHIVTFSVDALSATNPPAFDTSTVYQDGDTLTLNLQTTAGVTPGTITSTGAGVGYLTGAFSSTLVIASGYAYAGNTQNFIYAALSGSSGDNVSAIEGQTFIDSNLIGSVNNLVNSLTNNLETLRAEAQALGTNVALLNTRLDFTSNYINLLQAGSGKLTLADLNQEGANLLALQTRQQLGIQSLSFAGQNEKSILQLFR